MDRLRALLDALLRDRAGNTMVLVAAAIVPILGIIGGGVDMSRTYLAESRLQQACDSGVLAARKALGSAQVVDSTVETKVETAGTRFFAANYPDGAFGTRDRSFSILINEDLSIDGSAGTTVPTTIMQLFGQDAVSVAVKCQAKLYVTNTDVMMALDVTGSMNENTPGDSTAKIETLKAVVKTFHTQLEANKVAGSRIRYGFVPYSTNVNVGGLLEDDWIVDEWTYQSREVSGELASSGTYSYFTGSSPVSGNVSRAETSFPATYSTRRRSWTCNAPANTISQSTALVSTVSETVSSPLPGTRTTETYHRTTTDTRYSVTLDGTTCHQTATTYNSYVDRYAEITEPALVARSRWLYEPIVRSTGDWRTAGSGCMEERSTYEIDDYDNVDLTRALDLDLDTVPDAGDPDTQWRPQYPFIIYDRSMGWNGSGSFTTASVTTASEYIAPAIAGFAACPPAARKLTEMNAEAVAAYVDTLTAGGSTYHDIGMIWAGRLLSPNGLFAEENADLAGEATSRHLIFLTDGQTSSLDLSYGAYGVEPIDRRRWSPSSALSLTDTVEKRFSFACEEVKKRNITVWLIAFGTDLNPIMTECAGEGHHYRADNAEELSDVFAEIAKTIGDLRLAQ